MSIYRGGNGTRNGSKMGRKLTEKFVIIAPIFIISIFGVPEKGKGLDLTLLIHLPPMASISSFFYKNPQEVFDTIEDQFTLQPDSLVELTKAFLEEVTIGLTNYNQAMAMMCALIFSTKAPSLTCFQSFICYRFSRWHRNWVSYKHQSMSRLFSHNSF